MTRRFRVPSPAMIVAVAALFVALSAGAYAAVKVPSNSVGTKQLKNGAVTTQKVEKSSALAKAWGRINYTATSTDPDPSIDRRNSSGIQSVVEATVEGEEEDGVVCVALKPKFEVVNVTGNDSAGAVSPEVFASVNYTPTSGQYECPANADVRVSTFDKLNEGPVGARFSLVAH